MKYVGAGFILFSSDLTHIMLVCESKTKKWGFPKGHAEPIDCEDSLRTAVREMTEETGITENNYKVFDRAFKIPNTSHTYVFRYAQMNSRRYRSNGVKPFRCSEISEIRWVNINKLLFDSATIEKYVNAGNKYVRSWVAMVLKKSNAKAMHIYNEITTPVFEGLIDDCLTTLPLDESMSSTGIVTCP